MIQPITDENTDRFFAYLQMHISENGNAGPLFQPLAKTDDLVSGDKMGKFVSGFAVPVGASGWRRGWLAENLAGAIVGHVDLRGRPEPYTAHRALLGMGVRSDSRRQGTGRKLLEFVINWAKESGIVEIIDLAVLSHNLPAIKLYENFGFMKVGGIDDMYRVDGRSVGDVLMTMKL